MPETRRRTFTVSELNSAVKTLLESDCRFLDLCVIGELSNYKIYPSGHHYFTLKDQESSLRCVMFRSSAQKLRFRPENGMKVTAAGSLRVYSRDGAYQLYCTAIIPEGTGDLQVAFEQLKEKLQGEGLFRLEHKKSLPAYPDRVALITSSAGAAVHDMIRIFGQRWPMTGLIVIPVRVQGTESPGEIASAIRYANEHHIADLIITGRGGGSLEDLWAFNDELVARAIYASKIPVISAVGHEPDVTISDYVSDRRASTPSNAAEIAVPDQYVVKEDLRSTELRLYSSVINRLKQYQEKLETIKRKRVLSDAGFLVDMRRLELDRMQERLISVEQNLLMKKRNRLIHQASTLEAMSPLKVLTRGYVIAMNASGDVVGRADQLTSGEQLHIILQDGSAECTVDQVEKTQ